MEIAKLNECKSGGSKSSNYMNRNPRGHVFLSDFHSCNLMISNLDSCIRSISLFPLLREHPLLSATGGMAPNVGAGFSRSRAPQAQAAKSRTAFGRDRLKP